MDDVNMDDMDPLDLFSDLFDPDSAAMAESAYSPFAGAPSEYEADLDNAQDRLDPFPVSPLPLESVTSHPFPPSIARYFSERADDPYVLGGRSKVEVPASIADVSNRTQYRDRVPSDAASSIITSHRPDSGYNTISNEPSLLNQDLPQLQDGMNGLQRSRRTIRTSSSSRLSNSFDKQFPHACHYCTKSYRLQSDLRKHTLRHEQPFKCSKCTAGFANTNDRDRHRRTVHREVQVGDKAWRCAYPNCRSNSRIWHRSDNFRAHVKGHVDVKEEIARIIEESEFFWGVSTSLPATSPAPSSSSREPQPCIQTKSMSQSSVADQTLSPRSSIVSDPNSSPLLSPVEFFESSFNIPTERRSSRASLQPSDANAFPPFSARFSPPPPSPSLPTSDNFSTSSPASAAFRHNKHLRVTKVSSSQSRSTNTEAAYRSSGQLSRHARNEKAAIGAAKPIIHNDNASHYDATSHALELLAQVEQMAQKAGGTPQLMQGLKILKATEQSRNPGPIHYTKNQSRASSRSGRLSPAAGLLIERARSNDSRGANRKSQSTDRLSHAEMDKTSQVADSNDENNNDRYYCPRDGCDKWFYRRAVLGKHISRHDRLYACTFEQCPCSKTFGSKNDWKRHESASHQQPELWRCEECCQTFPVKESFLLHVQSLHRHTHGLDLSKFCKDRHIGANHAGSFWCGFEQKIIPISEHKIGIDAWKERHDHIAAHFVPDKAGKRRQYKIEEWLPPDGRLTKGQREAAEDHAQPADWMLQGAIKDCAPSLFITSPDDPSVRMQPPAPPPGFAPPPPPGLEPGRRSSEKRKRDDFSITCCQCTDTSMMWTGASQCIKCQHPRCGLCQTDRIYEGFVP